MPYGGVSKQSNHQSSPNYPGQHDDSYHFNRSSLLSNSPNLPSRYQTNRYDLSSNQDSLRNASLHQVSAVDGNTSDQSLLESDRDRINNVALERHEPDSQNDSIGQQDLNSTGSYPLHHLDNEALIKRTQKLLDQTLGSNDQDVDALITQWNDKKYQGISRMATSTLRFVVLCFANLILLLNHTLVYISCRIKLS